jgi:predicted nucleic acid-binding protein
MKIIVDANIVFSGILNSEGKIGDLIINGDKTFEFIAPNFLREEIAHHYAKLIKISKMSMDHIREAEYQICKEISFISEEQIKKATWLSAHSLVSDIDPKDTHYMAFSKHFKCKIWSGDKQLMFGLKAKGFKNIISTDDLYTLRLKRLKKQ